MNIKFNHITDAETELAFVTVQAETDDCLFTFEFEDGGDCSIDGAVVRDYLIVGARIDSDCALCEYPQMLAELLPHLKAYGLRNGMNFNC